MGGGIGMGNTCKPLAVSFQYMTKSTTNKKKIKKIKKNKKIKKKKKERRKCFLTRHRTLHNVELQNHSQIKQSQQKHSIFSKNKILFHQILFVL